MIIKVQVFSKKNKACLNHGLPVDTLFNVNIPSCDYQNKCIKITKQGGQRFIDEYEERVDPRNGSYYWIKGQMKMMTNPLILMVKQLKKISLVLHQSIIN